MTIADDSAELRKPSAFTPSKDVRARMAELMAAGEVSPADLSPDLDEDNAAAAEAAAPLGLIEVRTQTYYLWTDKTSPQAFNPDAKTWVLRGPIERSYRPRVTADGDADYVQVEGPKPAVPQEAPRKWETLDEIRARGYSGEGLDGTLLPYQPTSTPPESFRGMPGSTFTVHNRNRGVMRADGSINN